MTEAWAASQKMRAQPRAQVPGVGLNSTVFSP